MTQAGARATPRDYETHFVSADDGLKLHARVWGAGNRDHVPVVCLPGLSRTVEDFNVLAHTLAYAMERPRRVLVVDYRGRGASGYDPDPQNYNLAVELSDVVAVVSALNAVPAIYVGTSRGGILTMLLADMQPDFVAGAVLNDIGPVIEPQGLVRIKSYVGKLPHPATIEEGAEILRRLFGAQFPRLCAEDWLKNAHQTWREESGRLVLAYDARLGETLTDVDERPLPSMWEQFDALGPVPVMAIRGAHSDILSAATLDAMKARHSNLETIEVADQGHPPLLVAPDIVSRIVAFVGRV